MKRALLVSALGLLLGGCGARTMIGVPAQGAEPAAENPAPGSSGAAPTLGSSRGSTAGNSGAVPSTNEPLLLYEPTDDPPRALGGSSPRIVWTPGRFAVLFAENVRWRLYLALRFVDAATLEGSDLQKGSDLQLLTDDFSGIITPDLAWHDDFFGVVWSAGYRLFFQRVERDGQRRAAAKRLLDLRPERPNKPVSDYRHVGSLISTDEGFALTLAAGSVDDPRLLFARLSAAGDLLAQPVEIPRAAARAPSELSLGTLVAHPGGFAVPYNERWSWTDDLVHSVPADDRLFFVQLDPLGQAIGEPLLVYKAKDEIGGALAAVDDGFVVSTWDLERGIVNVPVSADGSVGAPVTLAAGKELKQPSVAAAPAGLAMLALSGEVHIYDDFATDLHFLSVDHLSGAIHSRKHLHSGSNLKCALESKDFVRQGDTSDFGIVWVELCEKPVESWVVHERRMYFARASAAR